ncbi:MAG: hypothetical protein ACXW28_15310, partial [Thermoanaerobaculia bacterium]
MRTRACLFLILALGAGTLSAQMTGSWSGTYTLTDDDCPGTFNDSVSVFATQSGNAFTAVLDIEMKFFDQCAVVTQQLLLPASGSVSGNAFSGFIFAPLSDRQSIPFTGTIAGTTWSAVATPPGQTITLSLVRWDSTPPTTAPLSGTWTGTYTGVHGTEDDPCANLPQFSFSGPLKATLFQAYERIAGIVEMRDKKDTDPDQSGNCSIIDEPDQRLGFMGFLGPSVIEGAVFTEEEMLPMTAAVTSTTITGSAIAEDSATFTFSLTKSSSNADPFVLEFSANPSVIRAGETTTLQWTVFNAATVSIDHGIGTKPAAGSTSVAPSSTTTYSLTGVAAHGATVTAQTTVHVAADASPFIVSFTATPNMIAAGACSTLAWSTA